MALRLAPMSEEDYQRFYNKSLQEYAYNQMKTGNWDAQNAVGMARNDLAEMLPQGLETPNAFLSNIINDAEEKIGMMWFYVDDGRPKKTAILLEFFLFPPFRGKGLELEALSTFEKGIHAIGVQRVELQVFGHQDEEIAMYTNNAYYKTMVLLAKDLD